MPAEQIGPAWEPGKSRQLHLHGGGERCWTWGLFRSAIRALKGARSVRPLRSASAPAERAGLFWNAPAGGNSTARGSVEQSHTSTKLLGLATMSADELKVKGPGDMRNSQRSRAWQQWASLAGIIARHRSRCKGRKAPQPPPPPTDRCFRCRLRCLHLWPPVCVPRPPSSCPSHATFKTFDRPRATPPSARASSRRRRSTLARPSVWIRPTMCSTLTARRRTPPWASTARRWRTRRRRWS